MWIKWYGGRKERKTRRGRCACFCFRQIENRSNTHNLTRHKKTDAHRSTANCIYPLSICLYVITSETWRSQWVEMVWCYGLCCGQRDWTTWRDSESYLCAKARAFCAGSGRLSELGVVSQISSVPLMFSMVGGVTGVKGDESSPAGDSCRSNKDVQMLVEIYSRQLNNQQIFFFFYCFEAFLLLSEIIVESNRISEREQTERCKN